MVSNQFAPIALFIFKRPMHTLQALEALARNPEFERSELHVFCDGSRSPGENAVVEATREVVRNFPHPRKKLYEAPTNLGLAASIINGVGKLCAEHGRVIVVEDDLIVAPVFLDFLNRALDRYATDEKVMQISGHMFPVELPLHQGDAVFLPFTTSWGWATWQRSWINFEPAMNSFNFVARNRAIRKRFNLNESYPYFSMLKKQKAGVIDSWAIRWYLSVFVREGFVLYPRRSLVSNEGFDGSGMNCGVIENGSQDSGVREAVQALTIFPEVELDEVAYKAVTGSLRARNSLWQRGSRYLKNRFFRAVR